MTSPRKRKPKIARERLRRGRHRGAIYTLPTGARVFLAHKHIADIFRNGASSVSDAIRGVDAYWSIDEALLMQVRGKGVEVVGILVRETGDIYLTRLAYFFGPEVARLSHPWVRPDQRYLNLKHFRQGRGLARINGAFG